MIISTFTDLGSKRKTVVIADWFIWLAAKDRMKRKITENTDLTSKSMIFSFLLGKLGPLQPAWFKINSKIRQKEEELRHITVYMYCKHMEELNQFDVLKLYQVFICEFFPYSVYLREINSTFHISYISWNLTNWCHGLIEVLHRDEQIQPVSHQLDIICITADVQ